MMRCFTLFVVGSTLFILSILTSAGFSRRKAVRSLKLDDVKCGCGKNMAEELVVKRTKPSDCTEVPYRGPRGVPKADERGYPLKVRVKRSLDKSRILIYWNLKYIPKRKRTKVTEFYLYLSKTQKKRRTVAERGACFVVTTRSTKQCRKKVTCEARYPKRRPRRVSLNLYYRFAARNSGSGGRRKRRGPRKFIRLKAMVGRKRRSAKTTTAAPSTITPKIRDCNDWFPSIDARCTGNGTLSVRFDPENPLADETEIALHEGISPRQKDVIHVPKGSTNCTFKNLKSGNYSVTLRPRSNKCWGVLPVRSPVVQVDAPPICSDWNPNVQIQGVRADPSMIEVTFDVPSNLQAHQIEVGLEDEKKILVMKKVNPRERKCTFNVTSDGGKTYSAMVRPLGCTDCKDYQLHLDPCLPSFHTSKVFRFDGKTTAISVSTGTSRESSPSNSRRHDISWWERHKHSVIVNNKTTIHHDNNYNSQHYANYKYNTEGRGPPYPVPTARAGHVDQQCADCCRRCACGSLDM